MAIRFDNATERLSRITDLPSFDADYTVMAWIYIATHNGTGNGACVVSIDDQTDDVDEFYIAAPGASTLALGIVTLGSGNAQGSTAGTTFSAGTWQHVCIVRSANNLRTGYRNGVSEVTHTISRSGRTAPTSMTMGSVLDDDLLNGRIACVKIWTAALSLAELANEMYYVVPMRTANLNQWHPCMPGASERLADYSGNGRSWTAVGTLTDEDGPPVAWAPPILIMPFPASIAPSGINGTLSATLDAVTSAATGTLAIAGAAAPTLAATTLSATGAIAITGAAAPTLANVTLAATGSSGLSGTLNQALADVTSSATGKLAIAGALSSTLGAVTLSAQGYILTGACIDGVLRQNTANGRYMENDAGPLVLAGFHTWYNLQDGGASDPPPAFTWDDYVASLIAKGCNFTKLWRLESARDWPSDDTQIFGVQPWARTGPGNAADGHLKFDLTTFDADYFNRLRARCIELGNAGIYVAIQLFNGFHIDNTKPGGGAGDPWAYHPFNSANNINSVNGDIDGDGIGDDARSTANTAAYNVQKAFVEHVIDTVNDLDNVIYEISNEDGTYAESWQKALVDYIHTYESGKAKQHPVGMTKLYPSGTNSMLTSSNADWISPDEDLTPAAQNSTAQAWMYDTDHTVGDTDTREWIFCALCQGYGGVWYMDPWDSTSTGDTTSDPTYEIIRKALGYATNYAARIDLQNATPQGSLASTGYCLAKTTGTYQFVAYQPTSGSFTLNLTSYAGTFNVEYLRISTGATSTTTVSGGAVRTLNSPWAGEDYAVLVEMSGIFGAASLTLAGLTLSATGTVNVAGSASVTLTSITSTATGAVAIVSSGAATLAGITSTATAAVAIVGSGAATLDAITLTATTSTNRTGSLAVTLDAVTAAAAGAVAVAGQLAATLASVTSTAAGAVAIAGSAVGTVADVTLSGAGVLGVTSTGQADGTLADITGSAAGTVGISGAGAATLQGVSLTAAGTVPVVGQAAATLADITVFATTSAVTFGTGAGTLGDISATGTGIVGLILAVVTGTVRGAAASGTVRGAAATGTVKG